MSTGFLINNLSSCAQSSRNDSTENINTNNNNQRVTGRRGQSVAFSSENFDEDASENNHLTDRELPASQRRRLNDQIEVALRFFNQLNTMDQYSLNTSPLLNSYTPRDHSQPRILPLSLKNNSKRPRLDISETILYHFISTASISAPISGHDGEYIDLETGRIRYVHLPISSDFFNQSQVGNNIQINDLNGFDFLEDESNFDDLIDLIAEEPRNRVNFKGQHILLSRMKDFLEDSVPLTANHLKAFEFNFPLFYQLVCAQPQKYFFPALIVSLEYDQDFTKFLKLWYGVKDSYDQSVSFSYQQILINIFLNVPRVSTAAFEFFSSSKNTMFFFDFSGPDSVFYGKFSVFYVAGELSEHLQKYPNDQEIQNLMKTWLLKFNYLKFINENLDNLEFSKINIYPLLLARNLFRTEIEYKSSLFNVFVVLDDDQKLDKAFLLLKHGKLRILLDEALKRRNFKTVKLLFSIFSLESSEDQVRGRDSSIDLSDIVIRELNNSFCSIKIRTSNSITVILPIINELII